MAEKPKYYWDACMWIALIRREANRFEACRHVIELAQKGEVEIWTSTFTFAEVFKRKSPQGFVGIEQSDDQAFEDYLEQDFVKLVQVDVDVGCGARKLLRAYPSIKKPQDAIHVVSALIENVTVFHTFDDADLLPLDNQLVCQNGQKLSICKPPAPPVAPDPNEGTLFEKLDLLHSEQDEKQSKTG